jgi:hypothetical protein
MVTGCSDATQATQVQATRPAQLGGPVGPVPGTMPIRLYTSNIFTGDNSAAVVQTSDDIVVGPPRFSTLQQASQPHQYSFQTPHGVAYWIKVPLTVAGTGSNWVALRLAGDQRRVKVVYDPTSFVGSTPGDPKMGSDRAALQSAFACGSGSRGFVQYNGGSLEFVAPARRSRPSIRRAGCLDLSGSPSVSGAALDGPANERVI